jgi:hypothetical protein
LPAGGLLDHGVTFQDCGVKNTPQSANNDFASPWSLTTDPNGEDQDRGQATLAKRLDKSDSTNEKPIIGIGQAQARP